MWTRASPTPTGPCGTTDHLDSGLRPTTTGMTEPTRRVRHLPIVRSSALLPKSGQPTGQDQRSPRPHDPDPPRVDPLEVRDADESPDHEIDHAGGDPGAEEE